MLTCSPPELHFQHHANTMVRIGPTSLAFPHGFSREALGNNVRRLIRKAIDSDELSESRPSKRPATNAMVTRLKGRRPRPRFSRRRRPLRRRTTRRRVGRRAAGRLVRRRGLRRLRRGRVIRRRRLRRSRRGRYPGWTYRTNPRPWPPANGAAAGTYTDSVYGQYSSDPSVASTAVPAAVSVVTDGLVPTAPDSSSSTGYLLSPALGRTLHPWFLANYSFNLGSLPAFNVSAWLSRYSRIRIGKCTMRFSCRASLPTVGAGALGGNPGIASLSRGGDVAFVCTRKTGPLSIPVGYVGGVNAYANQDAIANLQDFPYYRVKNAAPRLRRRTAVFRHEAAFGMKDVVMSFTPCYHRLRVVSYSSADVAFPVDDPGSTSDRFVPSRPLRPAWVDMDNLFQSHLFSPDAPAVNSHTHPNLSTPYHGVAVVTRPGSWTTGCFPFMTVRTVVRVHFSRPRTPHVPGYYSTTQHKFIQMNYGGRMYSL